MSGTCGTPAECDIVDSFVPTLRVGLIYIVPLAQRAMNIPILTYHSIDESGSVISMPPGVFRRQMKFLSETGWNVVALNDLARMLPDRRPISEKTAVLTFDDGFQNFYTEAFPVLEEYGFTATVFLVTDCVGKHNFWENKEDGSTGMPLGKLLSWDEIKELSKSGIDFGAHSVSHPDLTKIPLEEARREIIESKSAIEQHLGTAAATFAYPYGHFNEQVKEIVKDNFAAAVSTNLGKVTTGNDIHALKRLDTFYLRDERIFNSLSKRKFEHYMRLRQALRSVKKRFTTD